jgi:hypothetical protein
MYRPRELPANQQFTDDAGGAVDPSRGSSGMTSAVAFSVVQPHRLGFLKATSNAFVATRLDALTRCRALARAHLYAGVRYIVGRGLGPGC